MNTELKIKIENLLASKNKIIIKQTAIIDEIFMLLCERMTEEDLAGQMPLFEMMNVVSKGE